MDYKFNVNTEDMKGEVIASLLPWSERVAKSKELLYKLEGDKLVDRDDMERYDLAVTFAISRVKSVDVTMNDGQKLSSVDDLMFYKDGVKIINEVSSALMNGVSLAKK